MNCKDYYTSVDAIKGADTASLTSISLIISKKSSTQHRD